MIHFSQYPQDRKRSFKSRKRLNILYLQNYCDTPLYMAIPELEGSEI